MERRKALKNMGLALGYTVTTPTLLGLVQSCKNEPAMTWTPTFFTQDEAGALSKLVDIILPKTDTPSATEVKADVFIDRFANEVMEAQQQEFVKMSMGKFLDKALKDSGKTAIADLSPEDLEPVLAAALKISQEYSALLMDQVTTYNEAKAAGEAATLEDGASRHAFANNLRGLAIWGYKASEYVGEEVLAYLPVPGEYIACADAETLTQGKAWSL
ncbi:gluconate 2-dehydrogenase subunit 3 family protein [Maribacter sp. 2307ULW6-5]|uniref:gluconate 2-dehydrogenase subunit 3 family protein n=1 Tax=Maribacter sp. 2307ULW6-5 TaxID=3386275 RepID=UPI0039BD4F47